MSPRKYDHLLVDLMHAERIRCVRCDQVFGQQDKVTSCPNALEGGHALVPVEPHAS
jgi:hypothetical protein